MLSSQVKFSADRQTDRQIEKRTQVKQFAPDLLCGGIKMGIHKYQNCYFNLEPRTEF